jgi:uncharacterized membrane protein YdjX (TVP38/TMEM64 family)
MFSKEFLLRLKYPKLWLLLVLIVLSFFPFLNPTIATWVNNLGQSVYVFVFIAGVLFPIGVLAPFCASFLINSHVSNIFVGALVAGLGAVITDLIIFRVIRRLFKKDFARVKQTQLIHLGSFFSNTFIGKKIVNYISFGLAGWIVAAPLPNDMGKKLVAILSNLSEKELVVLSFIANSAAFLFFLWL